MFKQLLVYAALLLSVDIANAVNPMYAKMLAARQATKSYPKEAVTQFTACFDSGWRNKSNDKQLESLDKREAKALQVFNDELSSHLDIKIGGKPLIIAIVEQEFNQVLRSFIKNASKKNQLSLIKSVDDNGQTALHIACKTGNIDAINQILETDDGKLLIFVKDKQSKLPYHYFVLPKSEDTSKVLAKLKPGGQEVDISDSSTLSEFDELFTACEQGQNVERILELIESNHNYLKQQDPSGEFTPLAIAVANERFGVIQAILRHLDSSDQYNEDLLKQMMKIPDKRGRTPLMIAVDHDREDVIKLLLKHSNIIDITNTQAKYIYDQILDYIMKSVEMDPEVSEIWGKIMKKAQQ